MMTVVDFNALKRVAARATHEQRFKDAVRVYLFGPERYDDLLQPG